ncbi:hypothetical protein PybrP1_010951 [[Pythium] brassicae (nom. inval.)]|nr:hypothetical protein PybrP1_010951 [[Pythium] brassicae (nom. inval.)]
MRDATRAIERREDEYLRGTALRHAPPEKTPPPSPVPELVRALLQQIALGVLGLALAAISRAGARCFAVVLLALSAATAFALDQLFALQFTLESLRANLEKAGGGLADADVQGLVNGGTTPSLLHRFTLNGPAHFLRWLHAHCAASAALTLGVHHETGGSGSGSSGGDGDDDATVDSPAFYAGFGHPPEQACVAEALSTLRVVAFGVHVALTALVVVMAVQLALTGVLFLLDDAEGDGGSGRPTAASSSRTKQRQKRRTSANATRARKSARQARAPVASVLAIVIAITGLLTCALSASLFLSCNFATARVRWVLAAVFASGAVSAVTGLLVACCRFASTALVKLLLVLLAIANVYAVSHCMAAQEQLRSDAGGSRERVLRRVYELVAGQTCAIVSDWRAHTCEHHRAAARGGAEDGSVAVGDADGSEAFDSVCQEELAALVLATVRATISWLSALVATIGFLLLVVLAPVVRDGAAAATRCVCARLCCVSSLDGRATESSEDNRSASRLKRKSLPLHDARDRYLAALRVRDQTALDADAAQFDAEWAAMTGRSASDVNDATVVLQTEFEAIMRSLVLRRLTTRCKMDVSLSISKDGTQLFAKIFAPDNLLMATLCDADNPLELADFVDPGPAFWQRDKREIKTDLKVLDPHTIKHKLRLLASDGVVPKREAERLPNESLARVSARVHALSRAARVANGSLKCENLHLPYAQYVPHPEFQFLFKKHPNQLEVPGSERHSSVLRTIDCLRLTRSLIERELNVDHMVHSGLLSSFNCLHSASRFDATSRRALLSSWVFFWQPLHLPGECDPETHWFRNQLGRLCPFRQPLRSVRDYFGECIAFYFAWLAFYTQLLVAPACVAVVLLLFNAEDDPEFAIPLAFFRSGAAASSTSFSISTASLAFGVGVAVWGLLFAKFWERKSVWYQLEWGMTSVDLELRDRAGFWGDPRVNPVTNELETHFSGRKRLARQLASAVPIALLAATNLVVVVVLLLAQGYAAQWGLSLRLVVLASSSCQAVAIQWSGELISLAAHRLSEFENYQHETVFQASVVAKVFVLQLTNTFSGLLLLAFVDLARFESVPGLCSLARAYQQRVAPHVSVLVQLETLLLMIFLVRIVSHLLSIAHNVSLGMLALSDASSAKRSASPTAYGADTAAVNDAEDELALAPYRGAYEDYTQIVVQFGLVVMFSSVFPLAPLLAFVECVLELRLDALDLCLFRRRPSPDAADSIGPWATCLQLLLKLSFATLFGLVYFTADNYASLPFVERVSAFLAATLGCWLLTEILWLVLPSASPRAAEARARNEFLVERYFGADGQAMYDDDDDHYRERVELLRRLNLALRKQDDLAAAMREEPSASDAGDDDDHEGDEMIVGYFKPSSNSASTVNPAALVEGDGRRLSKRPSFFARIAKRDSPRASSSDVSSNRNRRSSSASSSSEGLPPLSMPSFRRMELAGVDAINEAAQRSQFDFLTEDDEM